MTVYVDDMQAKYRRMVMCHMLADTDEELHAMASAIDVARKWHQKPGTPHSHYDICMSKKAKAIKLGAKQIGRKEVAELVNKKRLVSLAIFQLFQCEMSRVIERNESYFFGIDYATRPDITTVSVFKGVGPDITFDQIQTDKVNSALAVAKKSPQARIQFPEHLAPIPIAAECPICGKPLLLNAGEGCEQDANGEWIATEIELLCTSEPEFNSPDWDDWYRWHYSMPYVDWLPLEQRVLRAVRKKYFFRVD
ncbi:DUF4031 domain-containing protein [Methylophilus sp. 3sh_L]|uniref:DUF4031 domain-containing protein n=1 Tax=Methylophilus sp. 3sh_L TaxID=3377114 RepID=UPI00398E9372